ncbi:discoidin domain-containing protein, partial [Streptomyces sp. NPDC057927]
MSKITWHNIKMTSNDLPTPYVASASSQFSSDLGAWRAFNDTNTSASDAWMTPVANGNTTGWIQIDFGSNKIVNRLKLTARIGSDSSMIRDFNILASNDTNSWVVLKSVKGESNWATGEVRNYSFYDNYKSYRYYRIYFFNNSGRTDLTSIAGILFGHIPIINKSLILHDGEYKKYNDEIPWIPNSSNNLIPVMTSNTTPSGRAFASHIGSIQPYLAFDGIRNAEGFKSNGYSTGVPIKGHLGYEFPTGRVVTSYNVVSVNSNPHAMPKDWTFEGSNDSTNGRDGNWDILDTQENQTWGKGAEVRVFQINNKKDYKIYRLNYTSSNGLNAMYLP